MVNPRRAILLFLVLAFGLTSIFYFLIITTGKPAAYVTGMMWCPGLAAIIACVILGRKLTALGFGWRPKCHHLETTGFVSVFNTEEAKMKCKFSIILCCITAWAGSASAEPEDTIVAHGKDAAWLFIETADAMQFDGKVLTLTGVDGTMVMFTDRPHRNADTVPLQLFIDGWTKGGDDSFRADPPNASVTTLVDGKFQVSTVELSEPKLDGTTLSFSAKTLEGTVPATGGQTSVFIDSGCMGPLDPRGC